jgi:catechol 1,2-dioxygenase
LSDALSDFKFIPDDLSVVEIDESKVNQRVIDVVQDLGDAIEGVLRKHGVTYEEYDLFRQMTAQLGPFMTGVWDPFISPMLERIHDAGGQGTSGNPEGPYYVAGAPVLDPPYVLNRGTDKEGTPLIVRGQVRAEGGGALGGAELDVWQCSARGTYSNLGLDPELVDWDFRGKIPAGEEGRFEFRTIKPPPYRNPGVPQIVDDFFQSLGRSLFRPAHIHFAIRHPALTETFITQLYFADDPYQEYDIGAAVRTDLVSSPVLHEDAAEIEGAGFERPFDTVDFDFVLAVGQLAGIS